MGRSLDEEIREAKSRLYAIGSLVHEEDEVLLDVKNVESGLAQVKHKTQGMLGCLKSIEKDLVEVCQQIELTAWNFLSGGMAESPQDSGKKLVEISQQLRKICANILQTCEHCEFRRSP